MIGYEVEKVYVLQKLVKRPGDASDQGVWVWDTGDVFTSEYEANLHLAGIKHGRETRIVPYELRPRLLISEGPDI